MEVYNQSHDRTIITTMTYEEAAMLAFALSYFARREDDEEIWAMLNKFRNPILKRKADA